MRLIDADKLVKTFCSHCVDHDECKSECMDLKIIKSMKTVDAEPIIRCKDCKYWAELTFLVPPKHHCGRLLQQYKGISERVSFETDADDFCSKGEKKDEID